MARRGLLGRKTEPKVEEPTGDVSQEPTPVEETVAPLSGLGGVVAPVDTGDETPDAVDETPILKKTDLLDRIVERTGLKRRDAKTALDATLLELGHALAAGDELRLPPLGKLRVQREKVGANASVYTCKLRRPNPKPEVEPEAGMLEAAE